ncbi:Polymeric immunoglobulin receptor [Channa argus]|nr:Polymeric immunoglobulin receptor [Channa argus]
MKVGHVLFVGFLSALLDANAGISVFPKPEGKSFIMVWKFSSCASRRFFCRRECDDGDVLIDTAENRTWKGRYIVQCTNTESAGAIMTVTIPQLIRSDSGRYRFGVGGSEAPDSYGEFEIRVFDAALQGQQSEDVIYLVAEGERVEASCQFSFSESTRFFCKGRCEEGNILLETTGDRARSGRYSIENIEESATKQILLSVTITDLNKSDSGRYTCGLGESLSSASFQSFEISIAEAPVTKPAWTLRPSSVSTPTSLGLTSISGSFSSASPEITNRCTVSFWSRVLCVPVIVLLFAVVLLLLYKLKTNRNKECQFVTYTNQPHVPRVPHASTYEDCLLEP